MIYVLNYVLFNLVEQITMLCGLKSEDLQITDNAWTN